MLWILLILGLLYFLFRITQLRGLLLGFALTVFLSLIFLLSRLHLRKSILLIGALLLTALLLRLLSNYLKSKKRDP